MHANDSPTYRTPRTSARPAPPRVAPAVEALEGRCLLSAATLWASLLPRPPAAADAAYGVHAPRSHARDGHNSHGHDSHGHNSHGHAPFDHHQGSGGPVTVGTTGAKGSSGTGPDVLGTWVGTYTSNLTQLSSPGGCTLTARWRDNFTGTFDTASLGGASATLSTVVVTSNRRFLIVVPTGPGQRVSLAGIVATGGGGGAPDVITGRYAVLAAKGFSTGVFRFERTR